jgi:hypothetical protein
MNLNRENILSTIRTLEYFENTFSKDKNVDCINQTISLLMSELVEPITDEEYDAYVVKKRKEEFKKSTELTECIVNWELYHKMRGKTNQIKTNHGETNHGEINHGVNVKVEIYSCHGVNVKVEIYLCHGVNVKVEIYLCNKLSTKTKTARVSNSSPTYIKAIFCLSVCPLLICTHAMQGPNQLNKVDWSKLTKKHAFQSPQSKEHTIEFFGRHVL